jgi:hypothetical protein
VLTVLGDGQAATPDKESAHVKVMVTSVSFHPSELGKGEEDVVTVGGVSSRLTRMDVVARFPALSTAVPEICWLAPSVVTEIGDGQDATPLVASEQANVTVTLELFQPARFGDGLTVAVTVGGTVSSVTTSLVEIWLPLASVATAVKVLLPSVSGTEAEKKPAFDVAGRPFTVTVAFGSFTVPRTVIGLAFP